MTTQEQRELGARVEALLRKVRDLIDDARAINDDYKRRREARRRELTRA